MSADLHPRQSSKATLVEAFARLTPDERQLLTCALAGNHPESLAPLRMEVLRGLAKADGNAALGERPYYVPSEVARELNIERIEVLDFAMRHNIPIYQGRLSWPHFRAAWESSHVGS